VNCIRVAVAGRNCVRMTRAGSRQRAQDIGLTRNGICADNDTSFLRPRLTAGKKIGFPPRFRRWPARARKPLIIGLSSAIGRLPNVAASRRRRVFG